MSDEHFDMVLAVSEALVNANAYGEVGADNFLQCLKELGYEVRRVDGPVEGKSNIGQNDGEEGA